MQRNYKPLGPYIRVVDSRNKEGIEDNLLGVSVSKSFMPSIANTVGTDFTKYKVVKRNQFTYIPDTSRRGDKIGIALLEDFDEALVSQAYTVFEITDKDKLDPEYLMMWFRRPEFDRYARYKSHGSVREIFDWDEMCDVQLPIPSIEKQREIVAEYNTVKSRIELNNQLIQKLEETAQAIYKQWFVEFEFPVTAESHPELVSGSQPLTYKSVGGKMIWNEELEKEIPEGWEVTILSSLIEVKYGKDYKHLNTGHIPLYGSGGIMGYVDDVLYSKPSVLIPRKGSLNNILYINEPFWSVDTMFFSKLKKEYYGRYVYYCLTSIDFNSLNVGSAVPSMTTQYLNGMTILKPTDNALKSFENLIDKIGRHILFRKKQINKLTDFQSVLLSKLATIEN